MRKFLFILLLAILTFQVDSFSHKHTSIQNVLRKTSPLLKSPRKFSLESYPEHQQVIALNPLDSLGPQTKSMITYGGLFSMWYLFSASFNVFNSYVKKKFPFPWMTATLQLGAGLLYILPLWLSGLRQRPDIKFEDLKRVFPIACLNAAGHALTVNAMFQKGGGSFTHVIKASEPVVSVILDFLINRVLPKPFTALSLIPITYGVAYASTLGDLNWKTMTTQFTSLAAILAMGANIAYGIRSILRKNLPKDFKERTHLDPQNEHGLTTLLSFLLLVPFALTFESLPKMWNTLGKFVPKDQTTLLRDLLLCGLSFYFNQEIQNVVLGSLGPVNTAVGNTLKRVVILVALFLFTQGEIFPFSKVLGCAIAVSGCLSFAICDSKNI